MFKLKPFSIGLQNKVGIGSYTFILALFFFSIDTYLLGVIASPVLKQASQKQYLSKKLVAQNLELTTTVDYVALKEEILAQINRVRTNPQAYAEWLETTKQYFEGTLLKLPGENPIRTNRGKEALNEAIALLKDLAPLPQLSSTSELASMAQEQIANITSRQANLNLEEETVSYGKYTAEGIVMLLVIDDGNPSRLNRQKILNPHIRSVGITCKAHQQYDNICAIAYSGDSSETIAENPQALEAENAEPNEIIVTTKEETIETNAPSDEDSALSSLPTPNNRHNSSLLLEKIQQGTLEEGDTTIPNDGSFYDSYPLEGNAGESFVISVESQEFDTFLAVMDREGNILEQNDDISENNSNSRVTIILPSNGVFSVIVNAYDEGGKGDYLLTVRR